MTKYIYHVSVFDQHCDCASMTKAVTYANSVIGCELLTNNMVFNYFSQSRPHKVNKKILGQLVQLSRTEVVKPSSNSTV